MNLFLVTIVTIVLSAIVVSVAVPAGSSCEILEERLTQGEGKLIRVACQGNTVEVDLEEGGSYSKLRVSSETSLREFLRVEYFKGTQDMLIVLDGKQFDVKDGDSQAEECARLKALMDDPEFEFFPAAVKLIHDELNLRGWESPAVMFLYRLGIAVEKYHVRAGKKGSTLRFNKRADVDPLTYDYNGPSPKLLCTYNGWSDSSMDNLIENECRGICGQTCSSCWKWVCGDCCMHIGCKRHDEFCSAGYFTSDCLTARGVMWDTITDTPLDC